MRVGKKPVRQSVTLPPTVATQVRNLAKNRKVSANRVLVDLIEEGLEAAKRKERDFFELAERFRSEKDEAAAKRLGEEMGRMIFGD